MANLREITIQWTVPRTPGATTVLHFTTEATPLFQKAALGEAFFGMRGQFSVGTSWTIANEGREIDEETGTLVGTWAEGTVTGGSGTGAADQVGNASQGLLRFTTGAVVDGRLLKGRMFLPGLDTTYIQDGEMNGTGQATIAAFFRDEMLDAATGLSVWSRPRPARETPPRPARTGSSALVTDCSVWSELAVLRRRR